MKPTKASSLVHRCQDESADSHASGPPHDVAVQEATTASVATRVGRWLLLPAGYGHREDAGTGSQYLINIRHCVRFEVGVAVADRITPGSVLMPQIVIVAQLGTPDGADWVGRACRPEN